MILQVDGASRSSKSRVGLLIRSLTSEQLEQTIRLGFPTSNNEAKHEVVMSGLNPTFVLSTSKLRIYSDSQLIVGHIQKEYKVKDERMSQYLLQA